MDLHVSVRVRVGACVCGSRVGETDVFVDECTCVLRLGAMKPDYSKALNTDLHSQCMEQSSQNPHSRVCTGD